MADYVIIGGGVYGAATAWHLVQAGADVHLLESRELATRASGGPGQRGVRANGRDVRELPLMRRAYALWPTLCERLGAPQHYSRTGHLLLAESPAQVERARAQLWLQQRHGVSCEWLDRDALREREPGLAPGIAGAVYCPADGVADHAAVTRAYAAAAQRLGASVSTHAPVASVETRGGQATAVVTAAGDRIVAERGVLVLANAGVRALLGDRVDLPVWNECFQVLISEPLASVPFRHLTGHMSRTVSLKTEPGDRVMISGGWRGCWDPVAEDGRALPEAVAGNVAEAVAVYPGLAGVRVAVADASHQETLSIDGVPLIDAVPGLDNAWFAVGWCGHGWAIAPVVAELLGEWALAGQRPPLLAPFGLGRFDL